MKKHPLFYSFIATGLLIFGLVYVPYIALLDLSYKSEINGHELDVFFGLLITLGFSFSAAYMYINKRLTLKSHSYVYLLMILLTFPTIELVLWLAQLIIPPYAVLRTLNLPILREFVLFNLLFLALPSLVLEPLFETNILILLLCIICPSAIGIGMLVDYVKYTRSIYAQKYR